MTVGQPIPHDSATLHVSGAARYTDDHPLPANTLHLAFGLSERARAKIIALDLDAVRQVQGVHAVLTAADLPFANDVSPTVHDEPLLAQGEVFYHGQPIFLVVADSHLNARKAARQAKIKYHDLPALLTIDDALAVQSQFEQPMVFQNGDPAAIKNAPHQIQGQIEIGGQEHFYLEGQAAFALPQDDGDMFVHCSTQYPTEIQHKVAEALGQPLHCVRVENRRMGGGFGGKESQGNAPAVACAITASLTKRPVKMRYDRDDDIVITGKRHDFRIKYHAGFDARGRLQAIEFEHFVRCGWAQDLSLPVADRAMFHADNTYHLPNVRITSHRLKTNTCSNTAFRGFGGPQGMVGIERVMDHIAAVLNLDPLQVRKVNLYGKGRDTTPYHMIVDDNIGPELIDKLAKTAEYTVRRTEITAFNKTSPVLKRGLALTPVKFGISFTLTLRNQAGALVHVYADGSIQLNHGGTEMGQGLNIKVAQVAADVFGLTTDSIKITAADTAKVPNSSATAASSGADLNGMACKAACETIRERLVTFASEHWQTPANEIKFSNSQVEIGRETIAFSEFCAKAYAARIQLSATGFYSTPKIHWDRKAGKGRPFFYFAYGAAVTEVILDTLTGENRILRTDILHDVGNSLNPAIDIGQIEGGYVQGAGWLTTEELVWDAKGALKTHAPSTYKIPACSDRPKEFNVALWDGANREKTIHHSKAVGEPPLMLGISALMALSDAVNSGPGAYMALDAPATPERLLKALSARQK